MDGLLDVDVALFCTLGVALAGDDNEHRIHGRHHRASAWIAQSPSLHSLMNIAPTILIRQRTTTSTLSCKRSACVSHKYRLVSDAS